MRKTAWWRTQSGSNLSQHPNSLICGNLQGILAICREFGLGAYREAPQTQSVTAKIPCATKQRIFRGGLGIWGFGGTSSRAAKLQNCFSPGNLSALSFSGPHRGALERSRSSTVSAKCRQYQRRWSPISVAPYQLPQLDNLSASAYSDCSFAACSIKLAKPTSGRKQ